MKDTINRKLIILLSVITSLFLIIALYLIYFELTKANFYNAHSFNQRNYVDENTYKRGSIYDTNGKLLTESVKTEDGNKRINTYNFIFSPIIGYSNNRFGKTGIESSMNSQLLNIIRNQDVFDKIENIAKDSQHGSDVYLTIDSNLQEYIYDQMGDKKGAVIVSDPKTGKIISMVSKPTFNLNALEENWDDYMNSDDAIMINRATQGRYEPGSIFKVISSLAFLDNNIDLNYYDKGSATIADYTVNNFSGIAYGEIDLRKALEVSSNAYFFEKSKEISNESFISTLNDFGFNKDYDLGLIRKNSLVPFKSGLSDLEKGNAAYGQGETYVVPIDMLNVINAIANNGEVYQPYLVDKIVKDSESRITEPKVLVDKINSKNAETLRDYLASAANYNGIGDNYGISIAGKTGTAENDTDFAHSWYIGMSPAEDPKYTIVVILENTGGVAIDYAAPLAEKIFYYLNNE